jgi:hypothetical protein
VQLLLAAINDLMTAAVAVVALVLGVVLIARGPRREPASVPDNALDPTPLPVPVSAPAETSEEPAPQPTTFRHGTIKLGRSAPLAAEPVGQARGESAPFARAEPAPLAPAGFATLRAEASASAKGVPASAEEAAAPAEEAAASAEAPAAAETPAPAQSSPADSPAAAVSPAPAVPDPSEPKLPQKQQQPPAALPRWKRRALGFSEPPVPAAEPIEDTAAQPVQEVSFKHGSIRFRK